MNTIIINGKRIQTTGNNISVNGSSIYIDGKEIENGLTGIVEIKFEGDLASLKAHNVKVKGEIMGDVDAHNLECDNIGGNVKAHNVYCKMILGSVTTKNISQ